MVSVGGYVHGVVGDAEAAGLGPPAGREVEVVAVDLAASKGLEGFEDVEALGRFAGVDAVVDAALGGGLSDDGDEGVVGVGEVDVERLVGEDEVDPGYGGGELGVEGVGFGEAAQLVH